MNAKNLLLVFLLALSLASGCSSGDKSGSGDSASTSAEKVTCDECGKEVAKASLTSHDGQMLCKTCLAEHGDH